MSSKDYILLWVITVLLFASAIMKIKLGETKKQPYSLAWKLQLFLFPGMMAAVLVLAYLGLEQFVLPAVFLGILEEFICWCIRKGQQK